MKILQRLSFRLESSEERCFNVENVSILGGQGNSKAGPAVLAAPEMWNILFSEG